MPFPFANLNELWSRTIAETLKAKGVTFAVICPGSRSSPLAFAMARTKGIEALSVLDERSAAFLALGIAKREDAPVALVCTSGTASANFFPAVIEAAECGVSLVVLTADRPHELRNCRAGQTIDQVKLYGSYPTSQVELALPENDLSMLRYLRQTVSAQVNRSMNPVRGPVHLNIPFRDPLPPIEDPRFETPFGGDEWSQFFRGVKPAGTPVGCPSLDLSKFADTSRGVLLVGSPLVKATQSWLDNVATLADSLNWPVLADGLNPIRNHAKRFPWLVTGYNSICRLDLNELGMVPEKAIVIGDLPISKTLRNWLSREKVKTLFLAPSFEDFDSTRGDSETVYFDFNVNSPQLGKQKKSDFAKRWKDVDARAQSVMSECIENSGFEFEGMIARILARTLPKRSALMVSNSMPPRDLDLFWDTNDREVEIFSSRGANGIDGILSTALGIAHRGKQTFLLTGDLALLHDSNGGLFSRQLSGSLTIILINNSGGGIFEMLPVSQLGGEFETYFATDQKIDFAKWAATYEIEYKRVGNEEEFESLVQRKAQTGVRLIEVVTDRKRDAAERKRIIAEVASRLG